MTQVSTNEFKSGMKIILDGEPYIILENEFVKPGKGQAFNRTKFRNLKNNRIIERTFKSGEKISTADVIELEIQYLYNDGQLWHFMDNKTYEQYEVKKSIINDTALWIKEQEMCSVILWNNEIISVIPPNFVNLTIVDTDPGLKGDTSGGGSKPATLETGAVVKVPLFVQIGELIKVDTRSGEYVSRAK